MAPTLTLGDLADLEELCSRYSRWLEDLEGRELDARDVAVVRFAGSLLKRTLSDSFAGAALGEDGPQAQVRVVARSLSLELARRKHRLAALLQLQQERHAPKALSVVTGNWGCGAARAGDPQLKMVLQWLAASAAGAATLVYYTCGHPHLLKVSQAPRRPSAVTQLGNSCFAAGHVGARAAGPALERGRASGGSAASREGDSGGPCPSGPVLALRRAHRRPGPRLRPQ